MALCLRTTPPKGIDIELKALLGKENVPDNIVWIDRQDETRYPMLLLAADAVVLTPHGEGYGRVLLEAMAMQRPVIATNWSSPTEFLLPSIAYQLPVRELFPASELPGSPPEARWASIDM